MDKTMKRREKAMKNILGYLFAVLIVLSLTSNLLMPSAASATSLPVPGTVVPSASATTYTLLDTSFSTPFSFGIASDLDTGVVQEAVVTNLTGNPFSGTCGTSCLSFIYQVKVSTGEVDAISMSSYAGFFNGRCANYWPS
jgi:hypothetical protein